MLPVGVCNERSWGPMIVNNFITVMSSIQASAFPQIAIKRDAVQLVLIGFGGCFLNTIMASWFGFRGEDFFYVLCFVIKIFEYII